MTDFSRVSQLERADCIYPNGISAETGLPLYMLSDAEVAAVARTYQFPEDRRKLSGQRWKHATEQVLGVIGEVDPADLKTAGWAVVFPSTADNSLKQALDPLIQHREKQAGSLCKIFEGKQGCLPGERCESWLARNGVSFGPVDPSYGIPYYVLLAGSPEEISFEFQYLLDVYWAVGRAYFNEISEYRRYADSVVAYECSDKPRGSRSASVFSTAHDFDRATQLFTNEMALPLIKGDERHSPIGKLKGFSVLGRVGDGATKEALTSELLGNRSDSPVLLVTASHGVGFGPENPTQEEYQGALVCQDWSGWGRISSDHWFSASDVPVDAQMDGVICFCFACYSAGTPESDDVGEFSIRNLAPAPFISRLPQSLMSHPNGGMLAFIGHVDKAWSHSFYSRNAGPQRQSIRDVLNRLLSGERVGQAMDQFDVRRAALSLQLTGLLRDIRNGRRVSDVELSDVWIAFNDAKNYMVMGDPAVQLRVDQLRPSV